MVPVDVFKGPREIPAKKIFKLHGDLIIAQCTFVLLASRDAGLFIRLKTLFEMGSLLPLSCVQHERWEDLDINQ